LNTYFYTDLLLPYDIFTSTSLVTLVCGDKENKVMLQTHYISPVLNKQQRE